jgi:spore photoproduct lyase
MFIPERIIFEKDVMAYDTAQDISRYFKDNPAVQMIDITSNRVKQHIPGQDAYEHYREGKKTLVVGIKKSLKFQSCKPSAHYQLPLVSGCMGHCQYCYLNTHSGEKPFIKVYVNHEDIFKQALKYKDERLPDRTIFEGAATSDPVPLEPYTHALERCITFFADLKEARFRFVTKYTDIDTLVGLNHQNHTEVRMSLNTKKIIDTYEQHTASAAKRIEAICKMSRAGYPVGFLIAPVFIYPNWKEEYRQLLLDLKKNLPDALEHPVTFEVISHRYTTTAKNRIAKIFPESDLPMEDENRQFKFGQFGYGKYVYLKEDMADIKAFFNNEIDAVFRNTPKEIKYII